MDDDKNNSNNSNNSNKEEETLYLENSIPSLQKAPTLW